ncbi:hypothetical protein JCM16161A_15340 [Vulcanisaeta sp. JCM 16161]|uniref:hypothetical protein n=1 Tax=Vulcanisaeta sp. JCM 16161 TaxID=1295372 RepID=UPI0006D0039A|nr:hypothetical protein [Vulcanisaeta sp. JCM 16161]
MVDEVIEARDYVAQLISKGWFRHAVGERGIRYIVTLLRFIDLNYKECSVNLDLEFLTNLLDEYYNTESRVRYFIKELMRVQGYDAVARQLINAYPMLPPDIREFLDGVARSLPSDAAPGALVEQAINELMKELEGFRERLISIINAVKSQCPKAYNQTS